MKLTDYTLLGWSHSKWMFALYYIKSAPTDASEAVHVTRWFKMNNIEPVEWKKEDWPSEFIMSMHSEIVDDLFRMVSSSVWFIPAFNTTIANGMELK